MDDIAEVLAVAEFEAKYGKGGRGEFIRRHILKNFYAFALMMAPYAVGHLKMSFFLEELGHRLEDDERVPFYLTNTLDNEELEQSRLPGFSALAEESRLAGEVKKRSPVLVILGNPPYSGHSTNTGAWIRGLIEAYRQVDGKPLGERNPKWLQDDYVKFLRFAQWKIDKAGRGLVGMITNNGYLDNATFRGMRQSLMQTFDEIYILDLHGNSLKKESCPDGSPDKNVFDIRQGVAIAFFVKRGGGHKRDAVVRHHDLFGQREDKYAWLDSHDIADTRWRKLAPRSGGYLFIRRDETAMRCYERFLPLPEIFPVNSVGIVTARDALTVHWSAREVWNTVNTFAKMEPELARKGYGLGKEVMQHMLAGDNLALITPKQHKDEFGAFATTTIGLHKAVAAYDINYFFPLYLYTEIKKAKKIKSVKTSFMTMMLFEPKEFYGVKKPNLSPAVTEMLAAAFGKAPAPEEVFNYIYAVLHAPSYRTKYAEFLKADFPRVPFTKDLKLFGRLAALGARLTALHLLKSPEPELDPPACRFEGEGDGRVSKDNANGLRYAAGEGRVYINAAQHFAPVPEAVWAYRVGGYQVCEKWLKDRKERRLELAEIQTYCRIVTALGRTIGLQGEIDALYPATEAPNR
ncbi:MAG: hypothetical protein PHG96_12820 [Kiritimatiellae bacterium]|nr:hypothetical protein [Kiritimatiellia bacterium]